MEQFSAKSFRYNKLAERLCYSTSERLESYQSGLVRKRLRHRHQLFADTKAEVQDGSSQGFAVFVGFVWQAVSNLLAACCGTELGHMGHGSHGAEHEQYGAD